MIETDGEPMSDPITILIVDDHEVVRKGVRGYLDTLSEFDVVAEAQSGEQAIDLAQKHVPDVILMDLVLPGMDGVETTRIIKNISPRTQIVVLTSYHDDALVFPALKAGAISYILKDMKMDKLAEAVRKAHHGEVILHPKVAARVLHNIRKENQGNEEIYTKLTDREMDVLKLIAKGYSNSQIAEDLVISENTVKGHVSNILSKLHLADRTQAAVYAWKQGIVKRESME
jgi:NarL family two-component system response regulator LiaR